MTSKFTYIEYIEPDMLEENWRKILEPEFKKAYMQQLRSFLRDEKNHKKLIYPKSAHVFQAFNLAPPADVKVVVLGQDPYHGQGQAHGLCFSVPMGVKPPPSLVNIYKELNADLGIPQPSHGNLVSWAKQGVLLLNSVLTVEQSKAGSHQGKGWEQFTDRVITFLNEQYTNLVFLLWGAYAQKKGAFIDSSKHCVLKAPHPSPFSVHQGFFGCRHFSKTNQYLEKHGKTPIIWQLDKEG
jgi:uracil-DNA glycosylase